MSSDPTPNPDRLHSKRDDSGDSGGPDSAAGEADEGVEDEQETLAEAEGENPGDRPEGETDDVTEAAENTVEELAEESEGEEVDSEPEGPSGPTGPAGPGAGDGTQPTVEAFEDDGEGEGITEEEWETLVQDLEDSQPSGVQTDAAGRIEGDPWAGRDTVPPDERAGAADFKQSLADGVTNDQLGDGDEPRTATLEAGEDSVGSWSEYDEAQVVEESSLDAVGDAEGQSADQMTVEKLGDDADASRAYVRHYDTSDPGDMAQAQRQMATHTALDHLGVNTPRHSYNPETGKMVVENVGGDSTDPVSIGEADAYGDTERLEKMSTGDYVDTVAANMVAGNADLHEENLKVGEDGTIYSFDYDRGGNIGTMNEIVAQNAENLAGTIDSRREDDAFAQVDSDTIMSRAEEIAQQAEDTGRADAIAESLQQQDEQVFSNADTSAAEEFRKNVTHHSRL